MQKLLKELNSIRRGSRISRLGRIVIAKIRFSCKPSTILVGLIVWLGINPVVEANQKNHIIPENNIDAITHTEKSFQLPLLDKGFQLSQTYSIFHPAIDLAAPRGTAIFPVADGQVVGIKRGKSLGSYGQMVLVEHCLGQQSLYAHLDTVFVFLGQEVTKSTVLGTVGNTGWSTGNHLHFQLSTEGNWINPLALIAY